MKKSSGMNDFFIRIMAVAGFLLWSIAFILRGMSFDKNSIISFIIGVLPNFGAALSAPFLIIISTGRFVTNDFKKKIFYFSLPVILVILFLSEIWHDKYMKSPFDINDLFASAFALIICVTLYMVLSRRVD